MGLFLEPLPCTRQGPSYFIDTISLLLMTWRQKKPGHQKRWYWYSLPRKFRFLGRLTHVFLHGVHPVDNNCSNFMTANMWILTVFLMVITRGLTGYKSTFIYHTLMPIIKITNHHGHEYPQLVVLGHNHMFVYLKYIWKLMTCLCH